MGTDTGELTCAAGLACIVGFFTTAQCTFNTKIQYACGCD